MVQVSYNAQHLIPWHWPVPAYLVTKGIGAGIFLLLSLGAILKLFPFDSLTYVAGGVHVSALHRNHDGAASLRFRKTRTLHIHHFSASMEELANTWRVHSDQL